MDVSSLQLHIKTASSRCSGLYDYFNQHRARSESNTVPQCAGSAACFTAFHPLCARAAGYAVVTLDADDEDYSPEGGEGAVREASAGDSDREIQHANAAGALPSSSMNILSKNTLVPGFWSASRRQAPPSLCQITVSSHE